MKPSLKIPPAYPLWGAEERAKRAGVHITTLQRRLQRWAEANSDIVHAADPHQLMIARGSTLFLARQSIWIGEAVYNLRSALDYLIYDFACINNGMRHVASTQFPICDSWAEFEAARTGFTKKGKRTQCRLAQVPDAVVDRLKQLQPCSTPSCDWTRMLRELSNPDKHRALTSLRVTGAVVRADHPDLAAVLKPAERTPNEQRFVVGLFFKDTDVDVIDTLKILRLRVRSVVEEFKPAFKWTGSRFVIEYQGPLPEAVAPRA